MAIGVGKFRPLREMEEEGSVQPEMAFIIKAEDGSEEGLSVNCLHYCEAKNGTNVCWIVLEFYNEIGKRVGYAGADFRKLWLNLA